MSISVILWFPSFYRFEIWVGGSEEGKRSACTREKENEERAGCFGWGESRKVPTAWSREVTWSREMSHLLASFTFDFHHITLVHQKNATFWYYFITKDHRSQRSRDMTIPPFSTLNNEKKWLRYPITQTQHFQHMTHSPWSCYTCIYPKTICCLAENLPILSWV